MYPGTTRTQERCVKNKTNGKSLNPSHGSQSTSTITQVSTHLGI